VARAEETITIQAADSRDCELLDLKDGESIVCITRRALGYDDRPIEWRCSHSAASRFRYKVVIR
jgi:GntR family transcriptional regulator